MSKVTYVLKSAGLGGGVRVVLEHISRLIERGHDVQLFYLVDPPDWFHSKIPSKRFNTAEELCTALRREKGIKIATWFETAYWVANSLVKGDRGYYLVQDIEDSYCILPHMKEWALNTYKLGLKPIVDAKWVYNQLADR